MIAELVDIVPPSLAPSCAAMTLGCPPGCVRASRLAEPACFDAALDAFAAGCREPDRGALVSLWSMYYFTALIVPATAAILCRDRVLPVGFEELGLATDGGGTVAFRLPGEGGAAAACGRFDTLVEGHLSPFVALCAARSAAATRVFWSNAAVILDWTLGELDVVDAGAAARAEARALLDGERASPLARPLRRGRDGTTTRRVCCLRYRLAGVADCGSLCPRGRSGVTESARAD